MKKKVLVIFSVVFGLLFSASLLLTGCATISDIKNDKSEIIYYGGSAVTVSGYTYFANAYTPYSESASFDYSGNSKISYLARIENSNLQSEYGKNFSPNNVEKVTEKVVGYQNQDMFILGNYIYYTSMNVHQDSSLNNNYSLVTFWRTKLNGDDVQELFTTEYFGDSAKFSPVGDETNGYYWMCYTGAYSSSEAHSGELISVSVGDKCGKPSKIADKVSSCVFSNVNKNGSFNKVIYTTTEEVYTSTRNVIYAVDYNGSNKMKFEDNSREIVLVDKIKDIVFFTDKDKYSTFYKSMANVVDGEEFENGKNVFVQNASISKINLISEGDSFEGYIYKSGSSNNLMYKKLGKTEKQLNSGFEFTDILFVDGDRVYYSTDKEIGRISVKPRTETGLIEPEVLVSMEKIESGKYGFDGTYVYFFAGLEQVDLETPVEDTKSYMYRIAKSGTGEYQLLGKTTQTRIPAQEKDEEAE